MKIPVIKFDKDRAEQAFKLHQTMMRVEREQPDIAQDTLWQVFKAEAYERFERAFKVAK